MSTPTGEPPFLLDGSVNIDKLRDLLAVGTELAWLDYKSECDLGTAQGKVALAKDVGAMQMRGGYLILGADGTGHAVGITEAQAKHFDEAQLTAKLAAYVGRAGELRSAVHDLVVPDDPDGRPTKVALIWVGIHPDGFCIFACDGQYVDNGKPRTAFRKGEVYARHGTSSELWNQADITAVRDTLVSRVKDQWRTEHAEQMRVTLDAVSVQTAAVTAPAAAFTWQLPVIDFEDATVELMRRLPASRDARGLGPRSRGCGKPREGWAWRPRTAPSVELQEPGTHPASSPRARFADAESVRSTPPLSASARDPVSTSMEG